MNAAITDLITFCKTGQDKECYQSCIFLISKTLTQHHVLVYAKRRCLSDKTKTDPHSHKCMRMDLQSLVTRLNQSRKYLQQTRTVTKVMLQSLLEQICDLLVHSSHIRIASLYCHDMPGNCMKFCVPSYRRSNSHLYAYKVNTPLNKIETAAGSRSNDIACSYP